MVSFCFFFAIIMYVSGLFSFCLNRKHLLMMLLSLEFIILALYFTLNLYLMLMSYEFYMGLIFLTMSVCESALGLAILVSLIRTHGNDYFNVFDMLW